ncbi:MAG: redoxin domain-containing protein [Elusimicrobia bacterium]|nr:redoxin domain-containing protein [Elusimicrobiota bacterium]
MSALWLWRLVWPLRSRLRPGKGVGGCFPDFRLRDLRGREHVLYDREPGRLTALWLTNLCGDCCARAPLLGAALAEARGGLRVLAVSILPLSDPLPARVGPSLEFPVLLDPDDVVSRRLGLAHPPGACPMRNLYLLDGKGTILFEHHLSALRPEAFHAAWRGLVGSRG